MKPQLVTDVDSCRAVVDEVRSSGRTIAFVATMGFLHEGHAELLREGRGRADHLVCSIFVNPTQFGENEDLDRYPRDLDADLVVCEREGVDLVFAPAGSAEIYPEGFQTFVQVSGVTRHLCGASRPDHFRGVATVVMKLFQIVRPQVALFGEKDYQQLVTLQTMVRDLDLPVKVVGVPIVRESDGLALSSRNAQLDESARRRGLCLHRAITQVRARFAAGERKAGALLEVAQTLVGADADEVDYVALAEPDQLVPLGAQADVHRSTRLFLAAYFEAGGNRTRLIDNAAVG